MSILKKVSHLKFKTRHQAKANNDAFDATVNGFLTPEQKTKFETIKKNKHDAHKAKVKAGKAKEDAIEEDIEG